MSNASFIITGEPESLWNCFQKVALSGQKVARRYRANIIMFNYIFDSHNQLESF